MTRLRRLTIAAIVAPLLGVPLAAWAFVCDPTDETSAAPAPSRRAAAAAPTEASPAPTPGPADAAAPPAAGGGWERHLGPLTPDVVARVRQIAGEVDRKEDVFAKVGDSATVNRAFLQCFSDADDVDLGAHTELRETIELFREGQAAYRDPYRRKSKAAKVGWSTWHVLSGRPSPLLQEVRAISPRFAVVMLGTNELDDEGLKHYPARMLRIVDALSSRGVVPILYTLLPRNDDSGADDLVPRYNLVVEAIARERRIPYIDFYSAIVNLPNRGLASDDVHPSAPVRDGHVDGCDLSSDGLRFGQNVRNLLTMMMLDRLREVLDGADAPDSGRARKVSGDGEADDPFEPGSVPFAALRSTKGAGSAIDAYSGCDADADESGPEQIYRLRIREARWVELRVLHSSSVDVDLHLLGESADGDSCIARDDERIRRELAPGTYHVAVDTFAGSGRTRPGEYVLLAHETAPEQ